MSLLKRFYDELFARFGPQQWWPGDTPWEVAAGAVLTQNTNWRNVEKAIARLVAADSLSAGAILALTDADLAELIRPAGYFNVKARRLKALAAWWQAKHDWAADPATSAAELRQSLLAVHGIGQESADSIVLYAFERPSFVIDTYTKRFLSRHGLAEPTASYAEMQKLFERHLPKDVRLYNEYHALIVRLGKEYCRRTPQCQDCPLRGSM